MSLAELVEKGADADPLRQMIQFLAHDKGTYFARTGHLSRAPAQAAAGAGRIR